MGRTTSTVRSWDIAHQQCHGSSCDLGDCASDDAPAPRPAPVRAPEPQPVRRAVPVDEALARQEARTFGGCLPVY